jgi:hypothetical protein
MDRKSKGPNHRLMVVVGVSSELARAQTIREVAAVELVSRLVREGPSTNRPCGHFVSATSQRGRT